MNKPLIMGAVAYAPKVVTIWEGFKEYFRHHDFEFDFVLYSNYEKQVEAQFDGSVDIAWNSPLAWVRADRMARACGKTVHAVAMRDTDCDLTSVLVVRSDSAIAMMSDRGSESAPFGLSLSKPLHPSTSSGRTGFESLIGKTIGFGAIDSPQANLIPRDHLRAQGLVADRDYTARRFDVLGGKHGDHIGGERDAALALMASEIDAAWMIDGNHLAFSREGTLPAGATRIVARTGLYDHCNFTSSPDAPAEKVDRFVELLLGMSWDDPEVRPLLELEGLKAWRDGRTSGYALLERAVDDEKFYDAGGNILEADYRY